jgi:eukaryotic-like serine/threonine-protein kinase
MKWLSDTRLDHLREVTVQPDFSATKYKLLRELASGGMGIVYLAEDPELTRQVAIKVLNVSEMNEDTRRRMLREAQIIARLEHPGIVPVHDVGTLPDGRIYYAMKLVRGKRLDEYAREVTSKNERLRKFQLVCDAVAFAHSHGVVHRDLKPQNIMIGSFGEVLVLDWGVAKIVRDQPDLSEADTLPLSNNKVKALASDETTHGTVIGTPNYMSPEQALGDTRLVDERSDVFSLGSILYFLLTGQSPHMTPDGPPSKPREIDPKVAKGAEAVCLKAMSADRSLRYSSASELSSDVGNLLDANPVTAYRETLLEKTSRWINKNRFFVLLVLSYLLMRIILLLTSRQ